MRVIESESSRREREQDETGEHKKEWGRKLKADYPLNESLVSLRIWARLAVLGVGQRERVFFSVLMAFIKAGLQSNHIQLKITS